MLGFKLPFYSSDTLRLSPGLSLRVLYHLMKRKPDVIHASSPGACAWAFMTSVGMWQGVGSGCGHDGSGGVERCRGSTHQSRATLRASSSSCFNTSHTQLVSIGLPVASH